jgi:hypothetical protein
MVYEMSFEDRQKLGKFHQLHLTDENYLIFVTFFKTDKIY